MSNRYFCMKKIKAAFLIILISVFMVFPLTSCGEKRPVLFDPKQLTEEQKNLENMQLFVDDHDPVTVKVLHYGYRNNRYVSLRDFASGMAGTGKHFQVITKKDGISILTGEEYTPVGGEGEPFSDAFLDPYDDVILKTYPMDLYPLQIDGRTLHYRTIPGNSPAGKGDCYISLTDLIMQLDVKTSMTGEEIYISTEEDYSADPEALHREVFYYETHAALLGDASTGEVFLSYEPDTAVAIASTSKLMTYLVLMDKAAEGLISTDDIVIIPEEAARLSRTVDGEIILKQGSGASFMDLLTAMLVPSSDECSLALAIHAAGSEEAFVEWMNRKAAELGLSKEARFYNCHGLPVYTDDIPASKIQNRMSAQDMFVLVQHLLAKYPEVLDITSMQSAYLESFDTTVENTNPLLYNVPGVLGLKTGTTNMAGDCVIGVLKAADPNGALHYVTVVQFGAEDETIRATLSEELIRYGKQMIEKR